MKINGQTYDWGSLECHIEGLGTVVLLTELRWQDSADGEVIYGTGRLPRGRSRGNYALEGSLKLGRREYDAWQAALKNGGQTLYGQRPFTITAAYANDDQPTSADELPLCFLTQQSSGMAQNDKDSEVELTFKSHGVRRHNGQPVAS
jgi:hypothetical protein